MAMEVEDSFDGYCTDWTVAVVSIDSVDHVDVCDDMDLNNPVSVD